MKITARTMVELLAKVYAKHGWTRVAGESRTKRVGELYDVTADHQRGLFIATPADQTQPRKTPDVRDRIRELK